MEAYAVFWYAMNGMKSTDSAFIGLLLIGIALDLITLSSQLPYQYHSKC